ncbi:hypothetical protein L1887_38756 [Cichorium endivia]|nr:hypothetical protein L1887_38756 [Cichorium endivia]
MVDRFPFPSTSAHDDSKQSSNPKPTSKNADNKDFIIPSPIVKVGDTRGAENKDITIPIPSLKVFTFADLERATRNFSQDLLLGKGCFGEVFLGWVDKKTFVPSTEGVGIPVAVKRYNEGLPEWSSSQGFPEWQTVDFNAKLGDFALAKFGREFRKLDETTRIMGTLGYIDPWYLRTGHVTDLEFTQDFTKDLGSSGSSDFELTRDFAKDLGTSGLSDSELSEDFDVGRF